MAKSKSDIQNDAAIFAFTPKFAHPYIRLSRMDRPIGTWLLFLPCLWGLTLATADHPALPFPSPLFLLFFAVGAFVMRGAGCTWNDITDRDFDGKVARTATRPIPAGEVSVRQALLWLALQGLIGLAILLQFNGFTMILGACSLLLVIAYPFMKRITWWPQAWLGLTFNYGVLMGWASMKESIDPAALCLYAAGFFWTLGYDTIYAHQDKEDDALIGVKSTARKLGNKTHSWLIGFYGACIILMAASFIISNLHWFAYIGLALGAAHFAWQIKSLDVNKPDTCMMLFRSNRDFALIIFIALFVAGFLT